MSLLGPSIDDLFNLCGRQFTLKTTLMIFDQMIDRLKVLHAKGIAHGNIKPSKIMMGLKEHSKLVHLNGFSLSRLVVDKKTGRHANIVNGVNLNADRLYASVSQHDGIGTTRKDDLIQLGYVMIHLLTGSLPWQAIKCEDKQCLAIRQAKADMFIEKLCEDCPPQFRSYFNYVNGL